MELSVIPVFNSCRLQHPRASPDAHHHTVHNSNHTNMLRLAYSHGGSVAGGCGRPADSVRAGRLRVCSRFASGRQRLFASHPPLAALAAASRWPRWRARPASPLAHAWSRARPRSPRPLRPHSQPRRTQRRKPQPCLPLPRLFRPPPSLPSLPLCLCCRAFQRMRASILRIAHVAAGAQAPPSPLALLPRLPPRPRWSRAVATVGTVCFIFIKQSG